MESSLPIWQQTLDAKLMQRLWRRAEQPGVNRPRQAQALLARHQNMVTRTPLAERLQRRVGLAAGAAQGQAPIVYAQLQPTPSNLDLTLPPPTSTAAPGGNTSQPMVVQRSVASTAPAAPRPSALPLMPLPAPGARHSTDSAQVVRPPPGRVESIVAPARAANSTSTIKPLPLVRSLPLIGGAHAIPSAEGPAPLITLPVVRVPFPDRDNRTDRLIVPSSRQPARYEVDAPNVPVVHEQMTHERGAASLPIASAPTALPLAAVAAPTPQPAPERSAASERQASVLRGSMLPAQNAAVESTADRAAAKQPSEIDIDQIVDRVHRKFIRQLAVEGERRGLR